MITQLYVFSPGSYVVADEWNANFNTLYKATYQHSEAIADAYDVLAFPNSDLTGVFNAVRSQYNSFVITGNSVTVSTEQEYYKTLAVGETLLINIPKGMNGEARVLVYLPQAVTQKFFTIGYDGGNVIEYLDVYFAGLTLISGYYYIMIYEANNTAQVKLIWTGV